MSEITIRQLRLSDREWLVSLLTAEFGSENIAIRGTILSAYDYPGFIGEIDSEQVGTVIYEERPEVLEIVTLNSIRPRQGVGTALIEKVIDLATKLHKKTVKAITTNDNTNALRFYQKRGFYISDFFPNAVVKARNLKPEIPKLGNDGIPIRDEFELQRDIIKPLHRKVLVG